jgi:hypothetical protein
MLRNCGQSLIEKKLQVVMVGANDKRSCPYERVPVVHNLDQPDELVLVSCKSGVVRQNGAIEERDQSFSLMQYYPEAGVGCVIVHNECCIKVG